MGDAKKETDKQESTREVELFLSFEEFLEKTHPSVFKSVREFWEVSHDLSGNPSRVINFPEIRLFCEQCGGERTFREINGQIKVNHRNETANFHPKYKCGDCQRQTKTYSLHFVFDDKSGGDIYKYGEVPAFGIPVPNRLLRLFGNTDAELFKKGRQCENLGYGIAAFAYYRRVVENHRNDLFDEIIKVCRTLGTSGDLITDLEAAKKEISFSKSMDKIKSGLPEGLLIGGHNPLNALHSALSVGLHAATDEDCLEDAQAVRMVLADLVDRIAQLKSENRELKSAVQRLISKKA